MSDPGFKLLQFQVPTWKQFHVVLWFNKTRKVMNKGKFKIHHWAHQKGDYDKMEKAF